MCIGNRENSWYIVFHPVRIMRFLTSSVSLVVQCNLSERGFPETSSQIRVYFRLVKNAKFLNIGLKMDNSVLISNTTDNNVLNMSLCCQYFRYPKKVTWKIFALLKVLLLVNKPSDLLSSRNIPPVKIDPIVRQILKINHLNL